jgi:Ca2+-binding EF-hand superfamily protein
MSGLGGVGHGGFVTSAIKQFQQNLFNQIDLNGDGSVSKSELEQAVTKAGGNTKAADALYSALDPNGSGGVSEQQFAKALPGSGFSDQMQAQMIGYQAQGWPGASSAQPGGQLAQNLFSQIDLNGDGAISKTELEQAVTKAGGTKEGADALYAKLDPNGTGSVSAQQFAQSLFQSMPHHHHHYAGETGAASASDGGSAADALTSLFNADGGGAGNSPTQIAQNMFAQTDLNGDGAITQSELEQAVTKAGGSKAGADALYAKLDPSGTGSVSQQQFIDALQPPSAAGNTAQDALLSLIKASGGSSSSPAADASTTGTLNIADLARAFALYASQLEQQLLGGIGATQSTSII